MCICVCVIVWMCVTHLVTLVADQFNVALVLFSAGYNELQWLVVYVTYILLQKGKYLQIFVLFIYSLSYCNV